MKEIEYKVKGIGMLNGVITKEKNIFTHQVTFNARPFKALVLPSFEDWDDYEKAWEMYKSLPLIKALS